MKKLKVVMLVVSLSALVQSCITFKANKSGVWMGISWSDAGKAAQQVSVSGKGDRAIEPH